MMRACHLNTCPLESRHKTQSFEKTLKKPEHVVNYMHFVAEELRSIMAQLGFRTVDEMVGQSQKLNMSDAIDHYKAKGIDLSSILHKPNVEKGTRKKC